MTKKKEEAKTYQVKVELAYKPGRWWYGHPWGAWNYHPPGWYNPATVIDPTIRLEAEAVRQLITALDEAGWIQPRLDERLRAEDLKITHRLLDIIDNFTPTLCPPHRGA